jgi:Zn-dependent protease
MRDPMSWSIPLPRLFGIPFRMHILFPLISVGLILRVASDKLQPPGIWLEALWIQLILLVSVILHELGHCFGARWVDGDANEVLVWPLGGLAFVDVPHTPKANFIATAAGPLVSLGLAVLAAVVLACFALVPPLNPLASAYYPEAYNPRSGVAHVSPMLLKAAKLDPAATAFVQRMPTSDGKEMLLPISKEEFDKLRAANQPVAVPMPVWQVRVTQLFALNWFLFLLNLLPAFPLDGGRLLQAAVWSRTDFRQGTSVAVTGGYAIAVLFFVVSIVWNETLLIGLAMFVLYMSWREHMLLQSGMEESQLGYDFSQGYTSLERDQPAPPRPKRPNFIQRWLQRRRAARLQKEAEQREFEERRMDELLDKVHRLGKESLTAEEKRFMERVSARYRNRS